MPSTATFSTDLQFCPMCGSVMPLPLPDRDTIPCARCPFVRDLKGMVQLEKSLYA